MKQAADADHARSEDAEGSRQAAAMDRHVGARIRERRAMLGISQQQLAHVLGVSYQQAHKYERGLNRISAGRLFDIATSLGVPVNWFFEGFTGVLVEPRISPRPEDCFELSRDGAAIDDRRPM